MQNIFLNWENETFEIFNTIKDSKSIAIDLGAWVGTTAIWLSKNFHHVIAVDGDRFSLHCLKQNLVASECGNVSICERPVAETAHNVVFGPRGPELNESISYVKNESDNPNDYKVRGITFKQLIHDYYSSNDMIKDHKISLIKCDIEGGEENIIEDILHFAYHNKCKVYLSFHIDWWKTKKITDFDYLFKFFKTNCPKSDVSEYLAQHPFASLLFEPLDEAGVMIKKNIPAVIIGYNQVTYIKSMVEQLKKYTTDIIVVDNNSTYGPLLDYYKNEFNYTLLRQKFNFGHTVYSQDFVQNLVGDLYLLTDPDLQFNSRLPSNFIQTLIEISNFFKEERVGFALCIDADDIREDALYLGQKIKDWEKQFWLHRLTCPIYPEMEMYRALIDTTFCLINKRYALTLSHTPRNGIRIAGDFTCFHLPWHVNYKDKLLPGEYEAYMTSNVSTNWSRALN